MDRGWVRIEEKVLFMLPGSIYRAWGGGKEDSHPWDLDCIWEQLAAQEAGLA